jgi:hypothetical protein
LYHWPTIPVWLIKNCLILKPLLHCQSALHTHTRASTHTCTHARTHPHPHPPPPHTHTHAHTCDNQVYYCSLEHHKSDWPRHKVSCKPAPAQSETTHGEGGTPPGAAASTSDGVGPTEAPLQPGQKSGLAQHLSEAVVARSRQQRREGAPAACAVCSKTSEEVAKLRSCA